MAWNWQIESHYSVSAISINVHHHLEYLNIYLVPTMLLEMRYVESGFVLIGFLLEFNQEAVWGSKNMGISHWRHTPELSNGLLGT